MSRCSSAQHPTSTHLRPQVGRMFETKNTLGCDGQMIARNAAQGQRVLRDGDIGCQGCAAISVSLALAFLNRRTVVVSVSLCSSYLLTASYVPWCQPSTSHESGSRFLCQLSVHRNVTVLALPSLPVAKAHTKSPAPVAALQGGRLLPSAAR